MEDEGLEKLALVVACIIKVMERKEYIKTYYESNKEQIKKRRKTHYESNKEHEKKQMKIYNEANKVQFKAYYEANKGHKKAYYEANKERIKETKKVYYEANAEKFKLNRQNQRNKRRGAEGSLDFLEALDVLIYHNYTCPYCGSDLSSGYHLDHIYPIVRGGSGWSDNYQVLCPSCNHKKHAKLPWEYEAEIGFERDPEFWNNFRLYNTPDCMKMTVQEIEQRLYA